MNEPEFIYPPSRPLNPPQKLFAEDTRRQPIKEGIEGYSEPESDNSSGGMPEGYGPEEWTVYVGGVVTTRNFLTDSPDP